MNLSIEKHSLIPYTVMQPLQLSLSHQTIASIFASLLQATLNILFKETKSLSGWRLVFPPVTKEWGTACRSPTAIHYLSPHECTFTHTYCWTLIISYLFHCEVKRQRGTWFDYINKYFLSWTTVQQETILCDVMAFLSELRVHGG